MTRLQLVWVVLGLQLTAVQPQARVELGGASDPDRGRVVMYWGRMRGFICNDTFNDKAAQVICRMMGKSTSGAKAAYFGEGSDTVMVSGLECEGHERNIMNCIRATWPPRASCRQGGSAGVICQTSFQAAEDNPAINAKSTTTSTTATTTTPTTTTATTTITTTLTTTTAPARTASTVILEESGQIVVVLNGVRGFICSDGFDTNDATVFCRSFNLPDTDAQVRNFNHTGGIIWLTNVRCSGREASISNCGFDVPVRFQHCRSGRTIGIFCRNPTETPGPPPVSLQVYLVDGPNTLHGRVVVEYNGVNGTVCDDLFNKTDARVICRMLGYFESNVYAVGNLYGGGVPGTPIWLDDVECNGTETNLSNCSHRGWGRHNCEHSEDVSVLCGPTGQTSPQLSVYLVGGPDPFHGRLIVQYDGENGTVCDKDLEAKDARVVCHMLGYRGRQVSVSRVYGPGSGRIGFGGLYCHGYESNIGDCFYPQWGRHSCNHTADVSISCGQTAVPGPAPFCVSRGFSSKIYGGVTARLGEWPHIVRIFIRSNRNGTKQCGGSVLNREWILTAAHCLYQQATVPHILVLAGTTGLRGGVFVNASSFLLHESFSLGTSHDIALIRLRTPLNFNSQIQPICLNKVRNQVPTEECYIAGWGSQSENQSTSLLYNVLQTTRYPIVPDRRCFFARRFNVNSHMCAGYDDARSSICQGDSGGPLMCRRPNSNQWVQWGLAVGGVRNGCGPNGYYTLWTEVAQYWSWISRHINN